MEKFGLIENIVVGEKKHHFFDSRLVYSGKIKEHFGIRKVNMMSLFSLQRP